MSLSNALQKVPANASATQAALYWEGVETLVRLLNPVAPHITQELWADLGHGEALWGHPWPMADAAAAKAAEITLVIQLNGKVREKLTVAADITEADATATALNALADQLAGHTVAKTIVVPGRLVNVVTA